MKLRPIFSGFCVKCQGVKHEECVNGGGRKSSVTCLTSPSRLEIHLLLERADVKR